MNVEIDTDKRSNNSTAGKQNRRLLVVLQLASDAMRVEEHTSVEHLRPVQSTPRAHLCNRRRRVCVDERYSLARAYFTYASAPSILYLHVIPKGKARRRSVGDPVHFSNFQRQSYGERILDNFIDKEPSFVSSCMSSCPSGIADGGHNGGGILAASAGQRGDRGHKPEVTDECVFVRHECITFSLSVIDKRHEGTPR